MVSDKWDAKARELMDEGRLAAWSNVSLVDVAASARNEVKE